MLHHDVLVRLCHARTTLRDVHDGSAPVREVARAAGMSQYHFIRLFKAVFGETPLQCRSNARVDAAKYLLLMRDYTVTRVCMEVGFSSLGSFSDLFSRRVGMSPTAYRRKMRPIVEVPGQMPRALKPGCFGLMSGSTD